MEEELKKNIWRKVLEITYKEFCVNIDPFKKKTECLQCVQRDRILRPFYILGNSSSIYYNLRKFLFILLIQQF
jgi:hypothetical protein